MSTAVAQEHLRDEANRLREEFDLSDSRIFLLEMEFHTPLVISRHKTNVPVPGLPSLDGILQYAAFYWCARSCAAEHPNLATQYLWQVNEAFEGEGWIDFPVPLQSVSIDHPGTGATRELYDCSVGLPVDPLEGETCYPVGSQLLSENGEPLKQVVDNIPLRRRVPHPQEVYKPVRLKGRLDPSRGATKSLDNRMYTLVVGAYRFRFRGDVHWVRRLLERLQADGVGVGKKASLGYGSIAAVRASPAGTACSATLGHSLTEGQKSALGVDANTSVTTLLKSVPSDVLFGWCADGQHNEKLLGSSKVQVLSIIPVLGGYTPPYWMKHSQTLVAEYGSLLYAPS